MLKKLLCKIGFHEWGWNLSQVGYIDQSIPDCAICNRCGIKYRDKKDENN